MVLHVLSLVQVWAGPAILHLRRCGQCVWLRALPLGKECCAQVPFSLSVWRGKLLSLIFCGSSLIWVMGFFKEELGKWAVAYSGYGKLIYWSSLIWSSNNKKPLWNSVWPIRNDVLKSTYPKSKRLLHTVPSAWEQQVWCKLNPSDQIYLSTFLSS